MEGIAGTRTSSIAELVDIMPTLAELAEVNLPTQKLGDRLYPVEGQSLVPVLESISTSSRMLRDRSTGRTTPRMHAWEDETSSTASTSTQMNAAVSNTTTTTTTTAATTAAWLLLPDSHSRAAFSQYPRKPSNESVMWQNNGIDHASAEEFTTGRSFFQ
mmetsp:Transcript_13839/g.23091  ORF Transcript_13839/g.23091 Transcript_13839/m.23091 type:complete len:159 (-) Transcript_13839:254-730(-)